MNIMTSNGVVHHMDRKIKVIIWLLLGAASLGLLALMVNNFQKPAARSNKLHVAASFYPLYFFSSQIGGEKARVINITPAGAEPHDYEPTAQDIAQIERSKLLILNGGGFEAWGDSIKQNLNAGNTLILTVGEGLTHLQAKEERESTTDPHIWLSPPLAEEIVDRITQGFLKVDPVNRDYYRSNAASLKSDLAALDKEFRVGLSRCSEKNIVTSHAAFGYLASDYGLHQVPIAGLSPDAEPSPRQLADIIKFARRNKIQYIFFESLVSPKLSETIAREVGAKTLVLNPIEGLSDKEASQGKTYFSEMRNNLANLRAALQCK
jgi:zinc transport system substrate-binding protein